MVKPHSMDLREHAMQRLATGETTYQVAAALNVAVSSVIKWAQKQRKSGSVEPGKMGGHKPFVIDGEHKTFVLDHVKRNPNTSLNDLADVLEQRGLKVHTSSISRFLQREDIQLKKDQPLERSAAQLKSVTAKAAPVQQPKKLTIVPAQAELIPVVENNQTYEQAKEHSQAQSQNTAKQENLLPQIELFQIDVKLPLTPVIAGLDMVQTLLKCRTQMINSYSEAVKNFYSTMWKR
jgi:putative transposase